MIAELIHFKKELRQELVNILQYWMQYAVDDQHGGFYGKIDNDNNADADAPKGLVLNARILWAFSAAYDYTGEKKYRTTADRAFRYLIDRFSDQQYGGYYWSIDKEGNIIDGKKQVYGIAFCLYGFSEYYKATKNTEALEQSKNCYAIIEKYSLDKAKGGYLEAFTRHWHPIDDLRLSAKDANEKKTMNTHLHVLEAYTNLSRIWDDEKLQRSIKLLLENFINHIVDKETGHLQLFFDEDWKVKGDIVSYGHDIEAAWLLMEAAELTGDDVLIEKITGLCIKMSAAAAEGLDKDGGLWYELEHGQLVKQKHSWPQAEAMVGFFNAWQLTKDEKYLQYVLNNWQFIRQFILDKKNGEWFWGVNADHTIMEAQDKAGFWKCPYHNTRACLEIINRIHDQIN
ncbi:MAG: AGE family epimerase/isomerase [Chitinophagaceae bacterium]